MPSLLRFILPAAAAAALALPAAGLAAGAGGVTGPAIYVDGDLYRTVATPTNFSATGAPDHPYDTIYAFPGPGGTSLQPSVATAAPGDPGYNGGRWQVMVLTFADYPAAVAAYDANGSGDLDSDEEVAAALAGGSAVAAAGPSFECPVIPLPRGGNH